MLINFVEKKDVSVFPIKIEIVFDSHLGEDIRNDEYFETLSNSNHNKFQTTSTLPVSDRERFLIWYFKIFWKYFRINCKTTFQSMVIIQCNTSKHGLVRRPFFPGRSSYCYIGYIKHPVWFLTGCSKSTRFKSWDSNSVCNVVLINASYPTVGRMNRRSMNHEKTSRQLNSKITIINITGLMLPIFYGRKESSSAKLDFLYKALQSKLRFQTTKNHFCDCGQSFWFAHFCNWLHYATKDLLGTNAIDVFKLNFWVAFLKIWVRQKVSIIKGRTTLVGYFLKRANDAVLQEPTRPMQCAELILENVQRSNHHSKKQTYFAL